MRPIDAATAADYLERVQIDPLPDGCRDLIGHIRDSPGSPLARALDSPLTLTLVHDTYRSEDDAHELLDFCGAHTAALLQGPGRRTDQRPSPAMPR